MKTLITGLILLTLFAGCKGLINPSSDVSNKSKICTMNYIIAPDINVNFELTNGEFESSHIFLNGEELMNKCDIQIQVCTEPYYTFKKSGLNKINFHIFDSSYQSLEELDLKLELSKNNNPTSVIERHQIPLNWTEEEQDNCQILRSANLKINE